MFAPFEALAAIATVFVITNAEQIESVRQQIECEITLDSLKGELKEFLMAGMILLDQAVQVVDRMSLFSVLVFSIVCLVFTSFVYVCVTTFIWKQMSHQELLLGRTHTLHF